MRTDHTFPPLWNGFWRWCFGAVAAAGLGLAYGAAEPAGQSGDEKLPPEPESITLPTTDGVEIGARLRGGVNCHGHSPKSHGSEQPVPQASGRGRKTDHRITPS